jgi:SOS response regulatory protein OraA/RecX
LKFEEIVKMLDIKKAAELLKHHFATVTHEEFLANLEEFCPEFFQARQETIAAAELHENKAHYKLEEASKLKIARRLLQRGLSVGEIAEIVELDQSLITQ